MAAPSVARKKVNFFCLKSVSGIIDPFSIKKMKKKIFTGKMTKKRPNPRHPRGSEGGLAKDQGFSGFFLLPSLRSCFLVIMINCLTNSGLKGVPKSKGVQETDSVTRSPIELSVDS